MSLLLFIRNFDTRFLNGNVSTIFPPAIMSSCDTTLVATPSSAIRAFICVMLLLARISVEPDGSGVAVPLLLTGDVVASSVGG